MDTADLSDLKDWGTLSFQCTRCVRGQAVTDYNCGIELPAPGESFSEKKLKGVSVAHQLM